MDSRDPFHQGLLEVFCGPMKSGKTRELINRLDRLKYCTEKYVLFKPKIDTRNAVVHSRFFKEVSSELDCILIDSKDCSGILDKSKDFQVIGIDEAQFFSDSIVHVINQLVRLRKNVLVTGLDLDFRGEPFGPMPKILAYADNIVKLTARCEYKNQKGDICRDVATRTQRLIEGKPAHYNAPLIVVEGSGNESYEARCLLHHEVPRN